jgi:hypothetical protein
MTCAVHQPVLGPCIDTNAPAQRDADLAPTGLLARIIFAVFRWRQRQLDREMADFIARSGGRLSDDLERRMMQHLLPANWRQRG